MRQRFQQNVGGTLRYLPSEVAMLGPTDPGATVTIESAVGAPLARPVQSAVATVDTFKATVVEDALAGTSRLTISKTSTLRVGARYALISAGGEIQILRVLRFDPQAVMLMQTLGRGVKTGDVLRGAELAFVVAPENAQLVAPFSVDPFLARPAYYDGGGTGPSRGDPNLFRAEWRYTCGGPPCDPGDCLFSISARLLKSQLWPDELQPYLPLEASHLVRTDETAQFLVASEMAWLEVLEDLDVRGFKPDCVMDPARLRLPHLLKLLCLISGSFGAKYKEWRDHKLNEYEARLEAALTAGDWYDDNMNKRDDMGEHRIASIKLTR